MTTDLTAQPDSDTLTAAASIFPAKFIPKELTREIKQSTAVALRLQGLNYTEVASMLGVNTEAARSLVEQAREAYRNAIKEDTREMIEQEGARLDSLLSKWHDRSATDKDAARIILDIHGARVRLYGLAAPDKIQMEPIVLLPPSMSMPSGNGLKEVHADADA